VVAEAANTKVDNSANNRAFILSLWFSSSASKAEQQETKTQAHTEERLLEKKKRGPSRQTSRSDWLAGFCAHVRGPSFYRSRRKGLDFSFYGSHRSNFSTPLENRSRDLRRPRVTKEEKKNIIFL
jgi:hypothetical protein